MMLEKSQIKVVVLGSAQDASVPQVGCQCAGCQRARASRHLERYPSCLGLVAGAGGKVYLVDASPRLPAQLELLATTVGARGTRVPDGILLTHAHIGHYAGLMYLGKEAMDVHGVPVFCTPEMARFLRGNSPWRDLVVRENIQLKTFELGVPFSFTGSTSARAFEVPHRNEHANTVGFVISGRTRKALYLPDIDAWSEFEHTLQALLAEVDYAFIDGTFFTRDELGASTGRNLAEVPHPPVQETLGLLRRLEFGASTTSVYFTHLNHTNPLVEAECNVERRTVQAHGHGVAREGLTLVM